MVCGVFLLGAFWVAVGGVLASVLPFFTGCWAAFCKCVAYSVLRGWCGLPGGRGWCVWAAVVGGGRVFAGVVREASAAVVAADACRCAVLPGRVCPGGASPVCVGCVCVAAVLVLLFLFYDYHCPVFQRRQGERYFSSGLLEWQFLHGSAERVGGGRPYLVHFRACLHAQGQGFDEAWFGHGAVHVAPA